MYEEERRRRRRFPWLLVVFAALLAGVLSACYASPAAQEVAVTALAEAFTPGF